MSSETNKSGSKASAKNVHLRNPSASKTASTSSAGSVRTKAEVKPHSAKVEHTARRAAASASGKTPAERSRDKEFAQAEKQLLSILDNETKKTDKLKKDLRQKSLIRFKNSVGNFVKCLVAGIIIFALSVIIILFTYYRSITKYNENGFDCSVVGFEYLDASDTGEKTINKLEERKNGTEKPSFDLSGKIIIRDSVPYVPFSAVKDYFNFSVAGNNESRTIRAGSSHSDYTGINTADFRFDTNEIKVNGTAQSLDGISFIENNEFYFPFDFIEYFVKGIKIEKTTDNDFTKFSITKISPDIYFGGASNEPLKTPEYSDNSSGSQANFEYTVDVSEYEKYINPKDSEKYLVLVNVNNKLSDSFVPEDLHNVKTTDSRPVQQICFDAAMSLTAMLQAADAAGFDDLAVSTGYRSYSYQNSLFNQKLKTNLQKYDESTAEKITSESVIYPGASEHQTGLAVDLHNMSSPMQSFANSDRYKWLIEHCADFGFILRYPQTKEDITGVKYEPWHFRFVGREHAQKIMAEGLSLEEYIAEYNTAKNSQ